MSIDIEELKYPVGRFVNPANYTAADLKDWISIIEALPGWLDTVIENLDEAQLKAPYRPEGWNSIQVIHHIADSHINGYTRLKLALTEDNPTVKPYSEGKWALLPDVDTVPINVSITLVHAIHRRWVALLKHMKPEEWERTYYHPEHERSFTLWQMTAQYAWHSRHHMEHIRQLRERMNW